MKERYYSLDVFRGATIALMILVNNPGSWSHIYDPLEHAAWHGLTPTDLVFPFFLFAVGNAMAFVVPGLQQSGNTTFFSKVFKRTFLIFLIGLLLNWSPFIKWEDGHLIMKPLENLRIMGVLQRIALCYLFAMLIVYFFRSVSIFYCSVFILLVYWLLTYSLGQEGDPYSLSGYFGTNWDMSLLGVNHMYKGEGVPFDPEGLSSTLPAIASVTFGFLAGELIRTKGKTFQMLTMLFVAGSILTIVGLVWDIYFPINKKIWSSSYVIITSGLAMLTIALIIYLLEFKNRKGWLSRFFDVFGKNPLFIFVLSGFLPRAVGLIRIADGLKADGTTAFISPLTWFYKNICDPISQTPENGSLLYALIMITFYWFIGWVMDKKKIYVKV